MSSMPTAARGAMRPSPCSEPGEVRSTYPVKQACLLILLAFTTLAACGKHNEVEVLHHEALAVAKYYAPQLDAFDARLKVIYDRGQKITASTPGVEDVSARLTEAKTMLQQLKAVVSPGANGKSAVEMQAAEAAKHRKVGDLEKLVHDTHAMLERGVTVIHDNLLSAESWLAYYDRRALALPRTPPAGGPPTPEPPPTGPIPERATPAPGHGAPAPGAPNR